MAILIKGDDFGTVWRELLARLLNSDMITFPREQETREIINTTIEVTHGLRNILLSSERNLNYRFLIAEWLWILGGLEDVDYLAFYNSKMKEFSDDGQILSGAYGKRLEYQWNYVFDALRKSDSRQAVATIWTPNPVNSKDIPCTISLQWLLRNGLLHCTANMRSSDIWLGLPHDFFTFSQLTNCLAGTLEVKVGSVTMNLGSSHLYSRDYENAVYAVNSMYGTLESPPIGNLDSQPSKFIITRMLRNDKDLIILPVVYPFDRYNEALKQNKAHALEVLRELTPIKE